MTTLAELHRQLVTAKEALRIAKDDVETTKTIAQMNTKGSNAEERKKADAQALLDDNDYRHALEYLRECESGVDGIQTEIDILEDDRKTRELTCRSRANEVLDRLAAAYERMAPGNPVRATIDTALPI